MDGEAGTAAQSRADGGGDGVDMDVTCTFVLFSAPHVQKQNCLTSVNPVEYKISLCSHVSSYYLLLSSLKCTCNEGRNAPCKLQPQSGACLINTQHGPTNHICTWHKNLHQSGPQCLTLSLNEARILLGPNDIKQYLLPISAVDHV